MKILSDSVNKKNWVKTIKSMLDEKFNNQYDQKILDLLKEIFTMQIFQMIRMHLKNLLNYF